MTVGAQEEGALGAAAAQRLLLDMAQERSLEALLKLIVGRLVERDDAALVRIWLKGPGDICASCHMRRECPDHTECLHLVASAGSPAAEPGADWSRLDGDFRRFPLGIRKVGHIAATGKPVEIFDVTEDSKWIARLDWAEREGVRGFGGQPLLFQGDVLGVIAVFTRVPFVHEGFFWLRMIADHVAAAIANARAFEEIERLRDQLEQERDYLRSEVNITSHFGEIIGDSYALKRTLAQLADVAPTPANVVILGESGVGKEMIARAIHARSARADKPLVKVNCASIPQDLFESEFFGHVKGSFTGAHRDRVGRLELADGGTLFLDEVGEIPLAQQGKLLRALQEHEFERVGDDKTMKVDVRVVAATNRDLVEEMNVGRFREDLYYRLHVFPIEVPPLRERVDDIALLAVHFLELIGRELGRESLRLTERQLSLLKSHQWPGNVRELKNVIERAVISSHGNRVQLDTALPELVSPSIPQTTPNPTSANDFVTNAEFRLLEKANITAALRFADWRIWGDEGAADLLGMNPSTLKYRMKQLGIVKG